MSGRILLVCVVAVVVGSAACWNFGDIISEDTRTRVNQDQALFECKTQPCDHNLALQYWWAFDEIYKHFTKYSEMGKLSFNTKLAIMSASIRRIFRHRTAVGFYLVRQLKDREILELGPLHTLDEMPPAFIEYNQGVIGRAWASRDMVFIQNATEARDSFPDDFHFYPHPTSELAVPVIDKDTDKVVAVYYHALEHQHSYQHMDFLGVRTLINLIEWF